MNRIKIRELLVDDLDEYFELNKPNKEFHKYNGPYFKKDTVEELRAAISKIRDFLSEGNLLERKKMIVNSVTDELIGEVSWYWKSEETNWLEIGIVIFNEKYWGCGIGFDAMIKWINYVFNQKKDIVRIGLTTWSGNERMMKLSEKLGFKCEAKYRNARIVDGKYYDSVSYGLLREEWEEFNWKE